MPPGLGRGGTTACVVSRWYLWCLAVGVLGGFVGDTGRVLVLVLTVLPQEVLAATTVLLHTTTHTRCSCWNDISTFSRQPPTSNLIITIIILTFPSVAWCAVGP